MSPIIMEIITAVSFGIAIGALSFCVALALSVTSAEQMRLYTCSDCPRLEYGGALLIIGEYPEAARHCQEIHHEFLAPDGTWHAREAEYKSALRKKKVKRKEHF